MLERQSDYVNLLEELEISVSLYQLRVEVDEMAGEEEVVSWRDSQRVSHECAGVESEGAGHTARDTVAPT